MSPTRGSLSALHVPEIPQTSKFDGTTQRAGTLSTATLLEAALKDCIAFFVASMEKYRWKAFGRVVRLSMIEAPSLIAKLSVPLPVAVSV